ncbi:MAG: hypothetical protein V1720_15270 [bacterium]
MKTLMRLFLIFLLPVLIYAQPSNEEEAIKSQLVKLFDASKAKNYSAAAELIVYRGTDKTREWKDTFKISNETELEAVKRICKKIKALLDLSSGYELKRMTTETESEGEWFIQEVVFKSGTQNLTTIFAFLKVNGNFVLGDID